MLLMVRDAYANYVVQTTLDVVSEGEEKTLLLEELNAHSTQLVCTYRYHSSFVDNQKLTNIFTAQLHLRQTYCNKVEFLNRHRKCNEIPGRY